MDNLKERFNSDCITEITALIDVVPEPIVLLSPEYEILAMNLCYQDRYGLGMESLGHRCYEVSHHYNRPCHEMGEECPMQDCKISGDVQRALHLHHTSKGEVHVDVELFPVNLRDGSTLGYIEIARDIITPADSDRYQQLVGHSPAFNEMLSLINLVAPSNTTVSLLGESGTGKEVISTTIHRLSRRSKGPFVPVDCSGLSEGLFESELFGHDKGAFTGATGRKQGLVEAARGGTLFLDEVGDIPLNLQVKLLRLLETGSFRRVGSTETQQAEFRLICATHRNLPEMVEKGEFRQDLYYRISPFQIEIPPLRERLEDIPLLVEVLLQRLFPGQSVELDDEAINCLQNYRYPGNIRELRNILERALLMARGGQITLRHLPQICKDGNLLPLSANHFSKLIPLELLEENYLRWAVERHRGDRSELAKILGIGERTLYRKLEKINENSPTKS
ncbi:MAG TPA: sigma-54-dependent Fis family transcriptional regulator [Ectothiorhodospiraceae bacterium]|nr:sigma-54-dependent Fis family transcriptional regulator [Ectothiorhodospiraceae bacterium]